jgi:hypothetical protein
MCYAQQIGQQLLTVLACALSMLEDSPPNCLRRGRSCEVFAVFCIFARNFEPIPFARRHAATLRRIRRPTLLLTPSTSMTARQAGTRIDQKSFIDRIAKAIKDEIAIASATHSGIAGFISCTQPLTRCNDSAKPIPFEDSLGIALTPKVRRFQCAPQNRAFSRC